MPHHIEIDSPLTSASFNRTNTIGDAIYRRFFNGAKQVVIGFAGNDIQTTPASLTNGSCPVGFNVGRDGYLYLMLERGLHAGEGGLPEAEAQFYFRGKVIGTGTMAINVGGSFRSQMATTMIPFQMIAGPFA